MLLLLTVFYLLRRVFALPIPVIEYHSASSCTDLNSCRAIWNIVWSCLVTTFACTWVAVHPNVPKPGQQPNWRWYSRPLRRVRIMLYALIGPEFVLIWAWRQWRVANRKSTLPQLRGMLHEILIQWTERSPLLPPDWSRVHGFFAAMGGFVDGTTLLSLEDIERLVLNEEIEYPIATREEIEDKSKGDAVTKALVVLQTTWFLLQCAARGRQHLALTELELATAAFALINMVIYALWWEKPLDVQCHIVVRRRSARDNAREASPEQNPEGRQPTEDSGVAPRQERDCWVCSLGWLRDARDGLRSVFRGWAWVDVWDGLLRAIGPFFDMMGGDDEDETFFVVGNVDDWDVSSGSGAILVTKVFGGIHCVAWSFDFPSPIEQLLWRISSIAITGIPLAAVGIVFMYKQFHSNNPVKVILKTTFYLLVLLYPISRIVLLVLSLTTLRSLPPSTYRMVQWTAFLPHV